MATSPAIRQAAREAQRDLETVSQRAAELAAASAASAVLGFAPGAALAAAAALVSVLSKGAAMQKQRVADDPPRDDFRRRTVPWIRFFDPTAFEPETVRLEQAVDRLMIQALSARRRPVGAAVEYATATVRESAYEGALVRALERAQGALEAGEDRFFSERIREARDFAGYAAERLGAVSEASGQLALALRSEEGVDEPSQWASSGRLADVLPPSALAVLYRAGIRFQELQRIYVRRVPERPRIRLADALEASREALDGFAGELARWDPASDLNR